LAVKRFLGELDLPFLLEFLSGPKLLIPGRNQLPVKAGKPIGDFFLGLPFFKKGFGV